MYFRKAIISDLPEIKLLWKTVFFDSEDYINSFIINFGIENCYVFEIDSAIVAMAFSLPTSITFQIPNSKSRTANLSLRYLYACATNPQYRRQGIMEILLKNVYEEGCRENVAGFFLHADNQNLENYYRKQGFEDFFYRREIQYFFNHKEYEGNAKKIKGEISFIEPDQYYVKRLKKLEGSSFVNWAKHFFRFLYETGVKFCEYKNVIFSYRTKGTAIVIDELLGVVPDLQIVRLLLKQFPDFESVEIKTIGNGKCFGQLKWCYPQTSNPDGVYFAYAME